MQEDDAEMYQAISELPQANRDTLAFLMLHLQRVLDTPEIRMGVESLSKAIGPSIIGFPTEEPSIQEIQVSIDY